MEAGTQSVATVGWRRARSATVGSRAAVRRSTRAVNPSHVNSPWMRSVPKGHAATATAGYVTATEHVAAAWHVTTAGYVTTTGYLTTAMHLTATGYVATAEHVAATRYVAIASHVTTGYVATTGAGCLATRGNCRVRGNYRYVVTAE